MDLINLKLKNYVILIENFHHKEENTLNIIKG